METFNTNTEKMQTFNGNDQIKAEGVVIDFEKWQEDEWLKCHDSYEYFIENYNYISTLGSQELEKIKLRDYQKRLLDTIHSNQFSIGCIPRQSGKSTSIAMYIVWCILFKSNYSVGIAADKRETAQEIMDRIKTAYENLPFWIQQGVKVWNVMRVQLENGSRVVATSTTKKTFRGQTHNFILLDEFAFVDRSIAEPFFEATYPVITSDATGNSKLVIISTPRGMNHFHKFWVEATEGRSEFKPVQIKWSDVPGRDAEFKRKTISNIGEEQWAQEFEAQFIGGTNTLISSTKLNELTFIKPLSTSEKVEYYKYPKKGAKYFMTVDVGEGKGQDYHAFTVIDITQRPFEIVCTYKCNITPSLLLPEIISRIGRFYNEAACLIETKSDGGQVADLMFHSLEYENLLGAETRGRAGQKLTIYKQKARGLSTSAQTKAVGCSNFKLLVETNQLLINSHDVLEEIQNFTLSGTSYKAEAGYHDDLVMCLVNFAWASTQPFFANFTNAGSIRDAFSEKIEELENALLPFGFILDSDEDDIENHRFL